MALAAWELSTVVVANIVLTSVCFRVYHELRIFWRRPAPEILRAMWGYSFYAFLINVCVQIVYYTDNLVVGIFISAGAVTFYTIGGGLIEYLRQLVSSLTVIFAPLTSSLDAQSQQHQLRRLLIQGTRAALFVALPIEVVLFFRGQTFIGLWMGEQYAQVSGRVLQILLVAQVFAIANNTSAGIAYGLGKHRVAALWSCGIAAANLLLSVLLVRWMGLEGVAWGTVIPSLASDLLFWPRYICKILEVPVPHYVWQGWIRPGLAATPFGLVCYFADRFWVPTSLLHFFLQIAALLPVFLLSVALCFWREVFEQLQSRTDWFARSSNAVLSLSGRPEQ